MDATVFNNLRLMLIVSSGSTRMSRTRPPTSE
jgi:hypothetical protein